MLKDLFILLRQLLDYICVKDISQYVNDIDEMFLDLFRDFLCNLSKKPAAIIANQNFLVIILIINVVINHSHFKLFLQYHCQVCYSFVQNLYWHFWQNLYQIRQSILNDCQVIALSVGVKILR